jgi:hypothetical protein
MGERVIKSYVKYVAGRSSLKSIFALNLGYAGCTTPLKEVSPGRFHPAVESRLFVEDVPYGLVILKILAEIIVNFRTPRIDFMMRWHQHVRSREFSLGCLATVIRNPIVYGHWVPLSRQPAQSERALENGRAK